MTESVTNQGKQVLVLRTCNADMTAHGGFTWPESGPVAAPDWQPTCACGKGLHGLLWGEGDADLLNWSEDARWLVVSVQESDIIDLVGKVKFPCGEVLCCGTRQEATEYLANHGGARYAIHGGTATAGYGGTATAGTRGTLMIKWWDGNRYRVAIAYVGEDGIEANTAYRLDDQQQFFAVPVPQQKTSKR